MCEAPPLSVTMSDRFIVRAEGKDLVKLLAVDTVVPFAVFQAYAAMVPSESVEVLVKVQVCDAATQL